MVKGFQGFGRVRLNQSLPAGSVKRPADHLHRKIASLGGLAGFHFQITESLHVTGRNVGDVQACPLPQMLDEVFNHVGLTDARAFGSGLLFA